MGPVTPSIDMFNLNLSVIVFPAARYIKTIFEILTVMESSYTESRPILPKQLQYVVILCAVFTVISVAATKYCLNTDMPDMFLPIIAVIAAICVILCLVLRYDITVTDTEVIINYIFRKFTIPFTDVLDTTVGEANQIRSYTGFNFKGVKNKYFSAVGEDMAVGVKMKGKTIVVFTSSDPEKIRGLIPVNKE